MMVSDQYAVIGLLILHCSYSKNPVGEKKVSVSEELLRKISTHASFHFKQPAKDDTILQYKFTIRLAFFFSFFTKLRHEIQNTSAVTANNKRTGIRKIM